MELEEEIENVTLGNPPEGQLYRPLRAKKYNWMHNVKIKEIDVVSQVITSFFKKPQVTSSKDRYEKRRKAH